MMSSVRASARSLNSFAAIKARRYDMASAYRGVYAIVASAGPAEARVSAASEVLGVAFVEVYVATSFRSA